jgi:hypothetical protein
MSKLRQNLLLIWVLLALAWATYVGSQPAYRSAQDSVAALIIPPAILFFVGWGLVRLWEIYGEGHWHGLPLHLRRGLLRLYIAVSAPWVAFFGYQFLDALQDGYRHHTAEAFWSLLIVPLGGPIVLLVLMWVLAGFAIRRLEPHSIAIQMLAGVDQYVAGVFRKAAEATTAALAIQVYEQNVSPLTQLAEVLARRLMNSDVTAVEIAPLFERVTKEAKVLMEISSAARKFNEQLKTPLDLSKLSGRPANPGPRQ